MCAYSTAHKLCKTKDELCPDSLLISDTVPVSGNISHLISMNTEHAALFLYTIHTEIGKIEAMPTRNNLLVHC